MVSPFMAQPRVEHWEAVMQILRYLTKTPGQGLLYKANNHLRIEGFSDADWAGSPSDRRSTSGYELFVDGNLISWKSKKQTVVARSSAEAECRAMGHATCELLWFRSLLCELRVFEGGAMPFYCDNQAATQIANNPVFLAFLARCV